MPSITGGTFTSGTGALTVSHPLAAANDLLMLFVESANEPVAAPAGWTELSASPQGTGVAAAIGAVALQAFNTIAVGGETSVAVADSGNHTCAYVLRCSGWDVDHSAGRVESSAAVNWTAPSVTMDASPNNTLIVALANDLDANASNSISTITNGFGSISFVRSIDQTVASGVGGGLGVWTSGVTCFSGDQCGTTAIVSSTSNTAALMSISLKVFGTPGSVDPGADTLLGQACL